MENCSVCLGELDNAGTCRDCSDKTKSLNNKKQKDFFKISLPGIDMGDINSPSKRIAEDIEVPDLININNDSEEVVPEEGELNSVDDFGEGIDRPEPVGNVSDKSETDEIAKRVEKAESSLKAIQNTLDDFNINQKLQEVSQKIDKLDILSILEEFKDNIMYEMSLELKGLKKDLDYFKERKLPKNESHDVGDIYRDTVYEQVVEVLDEIFPNMFMESPYYNLIKVSITSVYDDKTLKEGIVTIRVEIPFERYRYDFMVDVAILNGMIVDPQYIQRGLKIIPLTEESIFDELKTYSFKDLEIEDKKRNTNMFNSFGENTNIFEKDKEQNQVEVGGMRPQHSYVPENHVAPAKINNL